MKEREIIEKLLDEQKEEHKHQTEFITRLKGLYDKLYRGGYQPLDALSRMIDSWEQNLSSVDNQIKELEGLLKNM